MKLHYSLGLLLSLILASTVSVTEAAPDKSYRDKSLSTDTRVELLLKELTLDEKLSLLTGANSVDLPAIERLGIPGLRFKDGPNGVTDRGATCFPTGVTMASTWNPALIQEMGAALGRETAGAGYNVILGPTVNMVRTPLGGRSFEAFGEDPFLAGKIGAAYTRGVQSEKVGVSVKHFAANNQEQNRHTINSVVSERDLREIYFPAFKRIVDEADPWTIMAAYNRLNGQYCCHNPFLLDTVLKEEWGFKGLVVSDWSAVHGPDAANKGTDVEMPGPGHMTKVGEELRKGTITEERIDQNVRRILRIMFLAGVIDGREKPAEGFNSAYNRGIGRKVAEDALVLLKNEHDLLPFRVGKQKTIAVIGPNVKAERAGGLGSSKIEPEFIVSVWQGLTERYGDQFRFVYDQGCDFVEMPSVASKYLVNKEGKQGIDARYFNNKTLEGEPAFTCLEPNVDFDWAMSSPDKSVHPDDFSAIYEGYLLPPVTGKYKLGLTNNDGGRLYLDGKLIIDNWNDLRLIDPKVVEVDLEAGRKYEVKIEFFEWGVTAGVRFAWEIPGVDMIGDKFDSSLKLAREADAVILVGGFSEYGEGEGADRRSILLPGFQNKLIEEVGKANPNTAVVLINGSNVAMPWIDKVSAVVEAWYPGQEGGYAVADALMGKINPSGKLPVSFIHRLEDNPAYDSYPGDGSNAPYEEDIYIGYRYYDKKNKDVLFPFGHGLSYTQFKYSDLSLSVSDGILHVSFALTNTGKKEGKEVAQVYISDKAARVDRPLKELRGFEKVALRPGETKKVSIAIPVEELSYFDEASRSWKLDKGQFEVLVGSSSRDIKLKKSINL